MNLDQVSKVGQPYMGLDLDYGILFGIPLNPSEVFCLETELKEGSSGVTQIESGFVCNITVNL